MTPQEYRDWYGYDRADKELFEPPVKDCDSAATTVTDSNETTVATVKGR